MVAAHRFLIEDKIPTDMLACHHCDNPLCVNPKHIFFGTNLSNIQDCIDKDRFPKRFGEHNGRHKLSIKQVKFIRSYPRYRGSSKMLQQQFGISRSVVLYIRKGLSWKSIT